MRCKDFGPALKRFQEAGELDDALFSHLDTCKNCSNLLASGRFQLMATAQGVAGLAKDDTLPVIEPPVELTQEEDVLTTMPEVVLLSVPESLEPAPLIEEPAELVSEPAPPIEEPAEPPRVLPIPFQEFKGKPRVFRKSAARGSASRPPELMGP